MTVRQWFQKSNLKWHTQFWLVFHLCYKCVPDRVLFFNLALGNKEKKVLFSDVLENVYFIMGLIMLYSKSTHWFEFYTLLLLRSTVSAFKFDCSLTHRCTFTISSNILYSAVLMEPRQLYTPEIEFSLLLSLPRFGI